jgi:hypothetical protein
MGPVAGAPAETVREIGCCSGIGVASERGALPSCQVRTFRYSPTRNRQSIAIVHARPGPAASQWGIAIMVVGLTRYAGVARPRPQFSDFTWSVGDNRLPLPLA